MDGTDRMVLHDTSLVLPYALTVDYDNQILFWADYSLNKIESSHTDGSHRILLTDVSIQDPYYITYYAGNLYWTDTGLKAVLSVSVNATHEVTSIVNSLDPYGIQVISEERQPAGL